MELVDLSCGDGDIKGHILKSLRVAKCSIFIIITVIIPLPADGLILISGGKCSRQFTRLVAFASGSITGQLLDIG